MSEQIVDDDTEATLIECTDKARRIVVESHIPSLPFERKRLLDQLLKAFIVTTPLGVFASCAHLSGEVRLPPIKASATDAEDFFMFVWGHTYGAMLKRGMEATSGSCSKEAAAGLDAVGDRTSVFSYEPWREEDAPEALMLRLEQIAWAYAVGVSLAWTGAINDVPGDVGRIRGVLGALDASESALLVRRYTGGADLFVLCAAHGHGNAEASVHFAEILERSRLVSLAR